MKVLEIGSNTLPDAEKVSLSDSFETDKKYDSIVAVHVFHQIPYWDGLPALKHWVSMLNSGGNLNLVVPSAEWAAIELLSEKPSKAVQVQLHGGPETHHYATYTMRHLRTLFQTAGLSVEAAKTGVYNIELGDDTHTAEQHYLKGVKND